MFRQTFARFLAKSLTSVAGSSTSRRTRRSLTLESLEDRQLMSAAPLGALPDAYESDNTSALAKAIRTDGVAQVHSLSTGADVDWVKFTLAQQSSVTIQTSGSAGDTEMWLYRAGGTLVAYNDDTAGSTFSRISRTGAAALAAGTYYVKVGEYGRDEAIDRYTLSVKAVRAGDAYESDNTAAQARAIRTDGTAQTHSLHTATDVDWVKFTLTQNSDVTIRTNGTSGDTEMRLYNAAGTQLAYDDDSGNGAFSQISRTGTASLAAGTYYVKVNEYGSNQAIASYTISVKAQTETTTSSRYLLTEHFGGSWTDVEKSPNRADDEYLCWAATASNMLVWSGWAQVGSNPTADQVFQYFADHFSDNGNYPHFGIQWWFDGTNGAQGYNGWAQVEVAGGNFYPSQTYTQYTHVDETMSQSMASLNRYLRAGDITGLGIYTAQGGAHAITAWGVETDPQSGALRGVWVTDSDDDMTLASPPDRLRYYGVQYSGDRWYLQNYYGSNDWYISQVTALERRPTSVAPGGAPAAGPAATAPTGLPLGAANAEQLQFLAIALRAPAAGVASGSLRPAAVDVALFDSAVPSHPAAPAIDRAMETLDADRVRSLSSDADRMAEIAGSLQDLSDRSAAASSLQSALHTLSKQWAAAVRA